MTYRIMIQLIGYCFKPLSLGVAYYIEHTNWNKFSEVYVVPGTTFTSEQICQAYVARRWMLWDI